MLLSDTILTIKSIYQLLEINREHVLPYSCTELWQYSKFTFSHIICVTQDTPGYGSIEAQKEYLCLFPTVNCCLGYLCQSSTWDKNPKLI